MATAMLGQLRYNEAVLEGGVPPNPSAIKSGLPHSQAACRIVCGFSALTLQRHSATSVAFRNPLLALQRLSAHCFVPQVISIQGYNNSNVLVVSYLLCIGIYMCIMYTVPPQGCNNVPAVFHTLYWYVCVLYIF